MNDTYNLSMGGNGTIDTISLPIDMVFNDGHILLITGYSAIFVVSLVGNMCVLKAIVNSGRKRRKSRVNLMLMHLAIADLMVTLIMIPVEVGWAATVQWLAGDGLCRLFAFFRIFGHYLSSFILVCISIDRYFAVVHPLSLNAADRRGKLMILIAWLLAISCSFPQVIIFHVDNHPTHTFYYQCVTFGFFPTYHHEMVYNIFCLVMLYLAPLAIIIISYGAIIITIFQKSRSLNADGESNIRRSSLGYLGRARARTIKMTVSIVLAFFVCWTPYVIISLWFCFHRSDAAQLDIKVQKVLFIFACTNSCANPLVYGIFNFCFKPKRIPTWRSTTHSTNLITHQCRSRPAIERSPYARARFNTFTPDPIELSDVTTELLPKSLNSSYKPSSGTYEETDLPMTEFREGPSAPKENHSRMTTVFCNGNFFTSSASAKRIRKGSLL